MEGLFLMEMALLVLIAVATAAIVAILEHDPVGHHDEEE